VAFSVSSELCCLKAFLCDKGRCDKGRQSSRWIHSFKMKPGTAEHSYPVTLAAIVGLTERAQASGGAFGGNVTLWGS
jgi:hypothetical protein